MSQANNFWGVLRLGHTDAVLKYLEDGVDVNALEDEVSQQTALHCAAFHGHIEIARALILRRAPIDARNKNKKTPLHYAAENGRLNVLELLLDYHANVHAIDDRWQTPLHCAARYYHIKTALVLIKNFANVNAKDVEGGSPWMMLPQSVRKYSMELLVAWSPENNNVFPKYFREAVRTLLVLRHHAGPGNEVACFQELPLEVLFVLFGWLCALQRQ